MGQITKGAINVAQVPAGMKMQPASPMFKADWLKDIGYYDEALGEEETHLRLFLYGKMGSGKTTLISKFPNVFVLDTDAGGLTIRDLHVPGVKLWEAPGISNKVSSIFNALEFKKGPFAPDGEFGKTETIVLDSFSILSQSMLTDFMLQAKKDPLKDKAEYDQYGILLNTCIEFARQARRLSKDYNVIWTGLPDVTQDEMSKETFGGPLCVGSYRNRLGADFDEVWFLTTEGTGASKKHVLYSDKFSFYDAKSRLGLPYKKVWGKDDKIDDIIPGVLRRS